MKKFEYETLIRPTYDLMNRYDLNQKGKLGWELVSFAISEKAVYIFKRERVNE